MNIGKQNIGKLMGLSLYLLVATSIMVSVVGAQSTASQILISTFCGIVSTVRAVVGILAIALFLLGGALYAISHFLPTTLEFKKTMGAWATGMIIGGVIGVLLAILAQPIVSYIAGFSGSFGGGSITLPSC